MRLLAVVLLVVLAFLALLWLTQRSMIYFPSQSVPSADELGATVEEVRYPTEDGLTLEAWLVHPRGEPRGTVLVFNGNAGNRFHRLPLGTALADAGFSALLVDYRGYGGNPGSPHEEGLAHDARAALAYLVSRPDVDPQRVAYFGESLGAAVAARLAMEDPPAALILRSPFASLSSIAAVHYPFIPASLLLRDRYPTIDLIEEIESPLLVVAGSEDTIVPLDQSRRVFEAAGEPGQLVIIDGARHNDLSLLAGGEMIRQMVQFLEEKLPES